MHRLQKKSVAEFADSLGLQQGGAGYAYHSVPVALYASTVPIHRGGFATALRVLGKRLRGEEVGVLGDTPLDVKCGRAIGASLGDLTQPAPDWLVNTPREQTALELGRHELSVPVVKTKP